MKRRSPGRLAITHLSQYKRELAAATFWRGLFILVPMQVPIFTGAIVDSLTGKPPHVYGVPLPGQSPEQLLLWMTLGLFGLAALYGVSSYLQMISSGTLSRQFVLRLRKQLVAKVAALSLDLHQRYGAGDLMERVMNDTAALREFVIRVFIQSLTNIVRVGYPVLMMLVIDPWMTLLALSVLPPQLLISRYLETKLHAATRRSRDSQSDLTTAVKENLDGIETLKTLHAEAGALGRIWRSAEDLESDELRLHHFSALINGNVWTMTSIGIALTWWLGGARVLAGEMTLGTLVVFTGFVTFLYHPFRQFTTIATVYRRGLVSLERIHDLLDLPSTLVESPTARPLKLTEGRIEFRDVKFAYAGEQVLNDLNVTLEPRRFTALVGRSGSGKSSLLRLICRLYDPQSGGVLIDGQPLTEATLASIRTTIAVVPQQPMLFTGTLWENICLARPDATADQVRAACVQAGAAEFIDRLADGLDTRVGRGGASLSGGQAQRVAIARALLCDPKILLLDEPTSALDAESETVLVNTLRRLRTQMTVVVVAHRRATVCRADRILVMQGGQVAADGTHETLLADSEIYRELFPSDASHARNARSVA